MTEFVYAFELFLILLWFLVFCARKNRRIIARNWPMIGMLPALLMNAGRIHEMCTQVLVKSRRGTFHFRGPWFANMDMLATVDPENVHYILTQNFHNFPKGPKFREIFDFLGDGIFNADCQSWKEQRKVARGLITHRGFHRLLAEVSRGKVEEGLVPLLETVAREKRVVDLQDLFQRLTFDTTCTLVTGFDPGCLSENLPRVSFSKAMDDAEEAIFMRHIVPEKVWKLQKLIGIGAERKLTKANKVLDGVIGKYIEKRREETRDDNIINYDEEGADLLTSYMSTTDDHKFLRDTILNLMIAGRDTTSSALTWFIWLVSTHSRVENIIRDEIKSTLESKNREKWQIFRVEETKKLVYMHAAILEALRLYPPVPFQHKQPLEAGVLPSGHFVHPGMKILFSLYAMGRMESIWGKDCLEFKPERWILESGAIKHEPSYKFLAFNAGPRTCLGKEVALSQIKAVAATVIHNYRVWVAEGHRVALNCSVILYMRNGLKVRVANRWSHVN
ncbi:hypothetical protein ACS0TY_031420 [Phlomoides rotata]